MEFRSEGTKDVKEINSKLEKEKFYKLIFIFGIAYIFTDNIITNSSNFIIKHASKSEAGHLIMDGLFLCGTIGRILFTWLFSNYIRWDNPLSIGINAMLGKCIASACFVALILFEEITGSKFVIFILFLTISLTSLQMMVFLAMIKYTSVHSSNQTHGFSTGCSIAGVISGLFRIATILFTDTEGKLGLLIYSIITGFFCIGGAYILSILEMNEKWVKLEIKNEKKDNIMAHRELEEFKDSKLNKSAAKIFNELIKEEYFMKSGCNKIKGRIEKIAEYKNIYQKIPILYWCAMVHSYQTSYLIPSFILMIKPSNEFTSSKKAEAFPIIMLLIYSIGEYYGKMMLLFSNLRVDDVRKIAKVIGWCFLCYPVILMGNIKLPHIIYPIPKIFKSDIIMTISLLIFGFLCGYSSACISIKIPTYYNNEEEKDISANLIAYFISIGNVLGSSFSAVTKVIMKNLC